MVRVTQSDKWVVIGLNDGWRTWAHDGGSVDNHLHVCEVETLIGIPVGTGVSKETVVEDYFFQGDPYLNYDDGSDSGISIDGTPFGDPHIHRLNDVCHCKVEGQIYDLPTDEELGPKRDLGQNVINVLTGDNTPLRANELNVTHDWLGEPYLDFGEIHTSRFERIKAANGYECLLRGHLYTYKAWGYWYLYWTFQPVWLDPKVADYSGTGEYYTVRMNSAVIWSGGRPINSDLFPPDRDLYNQYVEQAWNEHVETIAKELSIPDLYVRTVRVTQSEKRRIRDEAYRIGLQDVDKWFPKKERNPRNIWGDLAGEAYNSLSFFSGNGPAFVKDFFGTFDLIKGMKKTMDALPDSDVKAKAKVASSVYLSIHYGLRLTMGDTKDLYAELKHYATLWGIQTVRARSSFSGAETSASYTASYQLHYDPFGQLRSELEKLSNVLDWRFRLGNVWDVVPWSFVFDWFTNIGDCLTAIDNWYTVQQVIKTLASVRSIKGRREVDFHFRGKIYKLPATFYYRKTSPYPQQPSFAFKLKPVDPKSFGHWTEAGALVIQKIH